MRRLLVILLLALTSLPVFAAKRVSIKQFERGLDEAKGKPDKEFVRWVSEFALSERVSGSRLARWKESVAGVEGRRALGALADLSAFENLPGEEIPKLAAPDRDRQQQMIDAAGIYVEQTLAKLPNFFATQAVNSFENTPPSSVSTYVPMHYADSLSATVLYRNGKEVMETHKSKDVTEADPAPLGKAGLLSSGEFGPVLHTVLSDAQRGKLAWSHWETLGATTMAVFRYAVVRGKSNYKVKVVLPGVKGAFQVRPGYHGEIGIDPATGTILRLTLCADMTDADPLLDADLMVEYGPVEIGPMTYICPVKSVALVMAYPMGVQLSRDVEKMGDITSRSAGDINLQTIVNDIGFGNYHVLRSEARVLTGDDSEKP